MNEPDDDLEEGTAPLRLREARLDVHSVDGWRALGNLRRKLFGQTPPRPLVGRYELLEPLGEGGCGLVYAAHDPRLDRRVAIKLMRPGSDGFDRQGHADARLAREARAIARLRHPNVIEVFDVGTYEGIARGDAADDSESAPEEITVECARPMPPGRGVFIVMALLEGNTLGQWLRDRPRHHTQVLSKFAAAGRGLVAAHRAGLLHRDFKPANVFVCDDGSIRVLDFGLARLDAPEASDATEVMQQFDPDVTDGPGADETERDSITKTGTVLGTPAYMAPEQHFGEAVDARSDQYSFCVALWEALFGRPPFTGGSPRELARAKAFGDIAEPQSSHDVPRRIRRAVERGLAVDPDARWPSMESLLDALAPTRARRTPIRVLSVGAASVAAVLASWAFAADAPPDACEAQLPHHDSTLDPDVRGRVRNALAMAGELQLLSRLDAHAQAWNAARDEVCEAPTPDPAAVRCLVAQRRQLGAFTDVVARAKQARNVAAAIDGLGDPARCVEAPHAGVIPAPPAMVAAEVEAARDELAEIYALVRTGDRREALARAKDAVERTRTLPYPHVHAEALERAAMAADLLTETETAVRYGKDAVVLARSIGHEVIEARAAKRLVSMHDDLGRYDEALEWVRHAEAAVARLGDDHPLEADLAMEHASVLVDLGRYDEARSRYDHGIWIMERTPEFPRTDVASAYGNRGTLELRLGRSRHAYDDYRRAHDLLVDVLGTDALHTAEARLNLGIAAQDLGLDDEAWEHYASARARFVEALGPGDTRVGHCDLSMSNLALDQQRLDEALARIDAAVGIFEQVYGDEHPNTGVARLNRGVVLRRLGDAAPARRSLRSGLANLEAAYGPEHPMVSQARIELALVEVEHGDPTSVIDDLEGVRTVLEQGDADPTLTAHVHFVLAQAIAHDTARRVEAMAMARRALRELAQHPGTDEERGEVQAWIDGHAS